MKDKYDDAVEYFKNNPEHIYQTWQSPNHHCLQHGCLFQFSNNNGKPLGNFKTNGDLINIRNGNSSCPDDELTEKIRNDEKIPKNGKDITIDNLNVFAEYQRLFDGWRIKWNQK